VKGQNEITDAEIKATMLDPCLPYDRIFLECWAPLAQLCCNGWLLQDSNIVANLFYFDLGQVVRAGFNADYGLFTATEQSGLAFPQPAAEHLDSTLGALRFLGLMFGKALYEGILLDVPLAPFFVSRLQGRQATFDELAALDPELHRSLLQVKRWGSPSMGNLM
jgi:hypothetical protein